MAQVGIFAYEQKFFSVFSEGTHLIEVHLHLFSRLLVFNAFRREQPLNVAGVFKLDFAQMPAFVTAKSEHHVSIIDTDFPKSIDGFEIC
jgi:hypothetical protein